jgi:hypothetical protein
MRNDARPIGHDLPGDPVTGTPRSDDEVNTPGRNDAKARERADRERDAEVSSHRDDAKERRGPAMPDADPTLKSKI